MTVGEFFDSLFILLSCAFTLVNTLLIMKIIEKIDFEKKTTKKQGDDAL